MNDDALGIIFCSVRDGHLVLIQTRDDRIYCGKALYMGPQSVWMVIDNKDLFVKFDDVKTASIIPTTIEGV